MAKKPWGTISHPKERDPDFLMGYQKLSGVKYGRWSIDCTCPTGVIEMNGGSLRLTEEAKWKRPIWAVKRLRKWWIDYQETERRKQRIAIELDR